MQKCTAEPVWTIGEHDITPMMQVYELFVGNQPLPGG